MRDTNWEDVSQGYTMKKYSIFMAVILISISSLFFVKSNEKAEYEGISFKEITNNAFFGYKNIKDEDCYRTTLIEDSIKRPNSTSREAIDSIKIENKRVDGNYSNLPLSYLDPSIMGCIKKVGSRSLSLFDVNNDSILDIVRSPNTILTNDGTGKFAISDIEIVESEALDTVKSSNIPDYLSRNGNPIFFDIDNDGSNELIMGSEFYKTEYIFKVYKLINDKWVNKTEKYSFKLPRKTLMAVSTVSVIDYNKDGFHDLILGWNQMSHQPEINRRDGFSNKGLILLKNEEGKGFSDATESSGINYEIDTNIIDNLHLGMRGKFYYPMVFPHQILAVDLNNDNWRDLVISGDYGTGMVLINKNGKFQALKDEIYKGESLMGISVTDINNDKFFDIFITQIKGNGFFTWLCPGGRICSDNANKGNKFFVSDKNGGYTDKAAEYGVLSGGWGWGSLFADFNNDGKKELVMAAGFRFGQSPDFLGWGYREDSPQIWELNSDGVYKNILKNSGLDIRKPTAAIATGDLNNDGLLDLVLSEQGVFLPRIFLNTSKIKGNYININPSAGNELYNKGIGARVEISYNNKYDFYESGITNFSHMSTGDNYIWFGVGDAKNVDIKILYSDGSKKEFKNIKTNQSWSP